jgi:hypothetical protein
VAQQHSVQNLPTKLEGVADVVVVSAAMASPVKQTNTSTFSK